MRLPWSVLLLGGISVQCADVGEAPGQLVSELRDLDTEEAAFVRLLNNYRASMGLAALTPTRLLSCGDLELTKSLALAGVGVALLPRRVAAYGQRGKRGRLGADMPFVEDTISLLYRGDIHRTKAAFRLKDALIAHGKTLEAESLA